MPDTATLARREAVELVRTGRWSISTGTWEASRDDLMAAVAALSCPAVQKPHLKVGHVDDRFTPGDGEPTLGWFENLRLTDGGHTLVADQVAPAWLSDIQAAAWPNRSVEGTYNARCGLGHTHPFVLTAVALLGVTPPGVSTLKPLNSLDDVKALYGLAASAPVVGEVRIAASIPADPAPSVPNVLIPVAAGSDAKLRNYWLHGEGAAKIAWGSPGDFDRCVRHLRDYVSDPKGLCAEYHHEATGMWPGDKRNASADESGEDTMPNPEPSLIDKVRSTWNASNPPQSQWIVEAADDHVIVIDDGDRSLHRLTVTVGDDGAVAFGVPTPVRSAYVPVDEQVAASVVFASRAESRPDVAAEAPAAVLDPPVEVVEPTLPGTEPQPTDVADLVDVTPEPPAAEPDPITEPKEERVSDTDIRSLLGVPDDADQAALVAAIEALKAKADSVVTVDPEQVAASAATLAENEDLRKEVTVLASRMEQVTAELAATKAEKSATVKASVLDEAQRQGKFRPADRTEWEKDYDEAPAATTRVLARIAPGTAVPVTASGEVGSAEPDAVDADSIPDDIAGLFSTPFSTSKEA